MGNGGGADESFVDNVAEGTVSEGKADQGLVVLKVGGDSRTSSSGRRCSIAALCWFVAWLYVESSLVVGLEGSI